ncbi:hypothetical protein PG988_010695 [Apiospora saccharicola]
MSQFTPVSDQTTTTVAIPGSLPPPRPDNTHRDKDLIHTSSVQWSREGSPGDKTRTVPMEMGRRESTGRVEGRM